MRREKYQVDDKVVAVLVNPKTHELVEVHKYGPSSVKLFYPGVDEGISGSAYWDVDETYDLESGLYVRSHSPSANVTIGKGYGVVLYSGLCLYAAEDAFRDGIASSDGGGEYTSRSASADRFWERCVTNGLATEDKVDGSEIRTHEDDGEDYYNYGGCERVSDEECEEVTNVSGIITVEYRASGGDVELQYMSAENNLAESGLIFALPGGDMDFSPPSSDVLVSLDLSNCKSAGLAELVICHAMKEDFDLAYIQRLVGTLPRSIYDQTSASRQLKFDFVPNAGRNRRKMKKEIDQVWNGAYGGLTKI